MNGFVAAVIAAFLSLFGIHQPLTHIANTRPSAHVASAAASVEDWSDKTPGASGVALGSGNPKIAATNPAPSPQATIINSSTPLTVKQYGTNPFVEKIIQSAPFTTGRVLGASTDAPDAKLSDLQDQIDALKTQVFGTVSTSSVNYGLPSSGGYLNNVALSQEIDQLPSTVTVGGAPVVTSNTLTNTVSNYLPLTGGTVTGDLTVTGSFSGGSLSLSIASTTNFVATNATTTNATSTNFFATTASSTNLFSTNANTGVLSLG